MKHMINHLFSSINAAISINIETAKQQLETEVIERLGNVFQSYTYDIIFNSKRFTNLTSLIET